MDRAGSGREGGSHQARSPDDPSGPTSIRTMHLCSFFHYGWNKMAWIAPCPLRYFQADIKVINIIKSHTWELQLAAYSREEESPLLWEIFCLIYSAEELFAFPWTMYYLPCCSQEEIKTNAEIILDIWCLSLNKPSPEAVEISIAQIGKHGGYFAWTFFLLLSGHA